MKNKMLHVNDSDTKIVMIRRFLIGEQKAADKIYFICLTEGVHLQTSSDTYTTKSLKCIHSLVL